MKNFLAIAIILVSFVATTALVGCAPSSNDKKERVRKGRGLNQKPGQTATRPGQTPAPAKPGTPDAPAASPAGASPAAAAPGAGPAASPLTQLAGANEAANKQIDETIAGAFGPNIPKKTLKDIPAGTYRLTQIISTVIQSNNSYRALLSARVSINGDQVAIAKDGFITNNRRHGGSAPLTSAAALSMELVKEGDSNVTLNRPFYYEMNIPTGDSGEVLSHDNPPASAVQPLSVLDATMFDVTGEFFATSQDGPLKGTKLHLRSGSATELRMLIERPTQNGVFRSLILIFNKAETTPVPPT